MSLLVEVQPPLLPVLQPVRLRPCTVHTNKREDAQQSSCVYTYYSSTSGSTPTYYVRNMQMGECLAQHCPAQQQCQTPYSSTPGC